jgi:hypothetical protein
LVLTSLIDVSGMLGVVILGMITGLTTLPQVPWHGLRTATWPLINTLAARAASLVWVWIPLPWNAEPEQAIGVAFLSGALYGLITGPALVFFLRNDPPAPIATGVQDTQPPARPGGADAT